MSLTQERDEKKGTGEKFEEASKPIGSKEKEMVRCQRSTVEGRGTDERKRYFHGKRVTKEAQDAVVHIRNAGKED